MEMKKLIACLACILIGTEVYACCLGDSLRIMSYNVRNGIGMDSKQDYERVAAVISEVNPDVIALQELDSMTRRSKNTYVLERIARYTGMNYVYGAAIDYDGGKYGIGIMSKEKPLKVKNVPLPGSEEARTLLIVEFKEYVFLATHLSLTASDQLASIDIVLKEIKKTKKPVFMAGDMNSIPVSPTQVAIRKYFETFTDSNWKTCNGECIDFIYGYKNKKATVSVINRVLVEDYVASDHCPIFVDVRYRK